MYKQRQSKKYGTLIHARWFRSLRIVFKIGNNIGESQKYYVKFLRSYSDEVNPEIHLISYINFLLDWDQVALSSKHGCIKTTWFHANKNGREIKYISSFILSLHTNDLWMSISCLIELFLHIDVSMVFNVAILVYSMVCFAIQWTLFVCLFRDNPVEGWDKTFLQGFKICFVYLFNFVDIFFIYNNVVLRPKQWHLVIGVILCSVSFDTKATINETCFIY